MEINDRGVDIRTDSRMEQRNDIDIAPNRNTSSNVISMYQKLGAKLHNNSHMAKIMFAGESPIMVIAQMRGILYLCKLN